jgi:hypothetical protein
MGGDGKGSGPLLAGASPPPKSVTPPSLLRADGVGLSGMGLGDEEGECGGRGGGMSRSEGGVRGEVSRSEAGGARPRSHTFWIAVRRGVVALGLGTRLLSDRAFVVLEDPDPPSGVRSIGT